MRQKTPHAQEKPVIRSGSKPIQVIAVGGGKGGVGKTNVAVNLSIGLQRLGRRVTLLDSALGLANSDLTFGVKPRLTLLDVLTGDATLAEVVIETVDGVNIVPASSGVPELASLSLSHYVGLIHAFSELADSMDTLVIDTAAGISEEVVCFLSAAQHVLLVVCNEPTSIGDSYALIKLLRERHGVEKFRIVCNMVRSERDGEEAFAKLATVSERFLDVELDHVASLPFDEYLRRAVRRQTPVLRAYPGSAVSKAFERLAEQVTRWPVNTAPSGQLEFFVERLLAIEHEKSMLQNRRA